MKHHQHGAFLISAIFTMLLLMSMSIALLNQQGMQQVNQTLDFLMLQGQLAAYSGKEWAVDEVLFNNAQHLGCNDSTTIPKLHIQDFQVSIECKGNVATYPQLIVTAERGSFTHNPYIKRQITCTVSRSDGAVYCQ